MSNPTSNFGWQMPTSTDLVTDLPADFEVFGQAVDTSLADLKGGTTGQVLKKNSNTDMDFVWSADSAGMTNPMTTTGDTIYSSSGSTPARLGIGSTGQVLTVAGGVPTWANAGGASSSYTLLNSGGTALTGATTVTVSGLSGYEKFLVFIKSASSASTADISVRVNADSTAGNYWVAGGYATYTSTYGSLTFQALCSIGADAVRLGSLGSSATNEICATVKIDGGNSTGWKSWTMTSGTDVVTGNSTSQGWTQGIYKGSAVISSISVVSSSGNLDNGTVYIFGSAN